MLADLKIFLRVGLQYIHTEYRTVFCAKKVKNCKVNHPWKPSFNKDEIKLKYLIHQAKAKMKNILTFYVILTQRNL